MRLLRASFILVPCVIVVALGCAKPPQTDPVDGNLSLKLPKSKDPPDYDKSRVSKLTVDGQDYSEPRGENRTLKVKSAAGTDQVTIVFNYWPTTYENIIRTKVVKLNKDQTVHVDMTVRDPNTPDEIKPIFVPTPPQVVIEMVRLGKIGPDDIVYDIGCGEGEMLLQAVKESGAKKGVGIELNEAIYKKCLQHRKDQGLDDKVEFRHGDALKIKDYSEATVVLLYVGDQLGEALKPALKESLKPGTRIVSHRFLMGDDWPPDETRTIQARDNYGENTEFKLHLWTIKKK